MSSSRTYYAALQTYVLASQADISRIGIDEVSEMISMFWDEETQHDLDLSPLHQALLPQAGPLQKSRIELLSTYINNRDTGSATPLMWAARRGDAQSLKLLLEYGADPNITSSCRCTALHYAVGHGNESCIRLLLEYGASPSAVDSRGNQPLHYLSSPIHYEPQAGKIDALVQHGADVNARATDGITPLAALFRSYKAHAASVDIARHLIEIGADVDIVDNEGVSSVPFTIAQDNAPMLRYLLDIGVELRVRPAPKIISIFHMAAMMAGIEIWNILKDLVRQGYFQGLANCITDSQGRSPWFYFENFRDDYFFSNRQDYEVEKEKFTELMDELERSISPKSVDLFGPLPPGVESCP
jgi:ankyrin repeat protein